MKSLLIIAVLFSSFSAWACNGWIPESEALRAIALEPGVGAITCKDKPNEACLCFDGIDWEAASIEADAQTGKKQLVEKADKKAAKEARKAQEKADLEAKIAARKAVLKDIDKATTIAQLRAVVKALLEELGQ